MIKKKANKKQWTHLPALPHRRFSPQTPAKISTQAASAMSLFHHHHLPLLHYQAYWIQSPRSRVLRDQSILQTSQRPPRSRIPDRRREISPSRHDLPVPATGGTWIPSEIRHQNALMEWKKWTMERSLFRCLPSSLAFLRFVFFFLPLFCLPLPLSANNSSLCLWCPFFSSLFDIRC